MGASASDPRMVWVADLDGGNRICLGYGSSPVINGDRVVWQDGNSDYLTWRVGDTEPTRVTSNYAGQYNWHLKFDGDRLVWATNTGLDWKIWTWAEGDTAPSIISDDPASDEDMPAVSGDRVAWGSYTSDGPWVQFLTKRIGDESPQVITPVGFASHEGPLVSGAFGRGGGPR
ncbi:MAG: hypothetical protein WBJ62_05960 [Coriobacteriia bacterium]